MSATGPLLVVVLAFSSLAAGPGGQAEPEIHDVVVRVGDRTVHALCTRGEREVVVMHGEGAATARTWRPVLERLAGTVGACVYDRPGTGASGPAPTERGWYELSDELRRVHAALGVARTYTLVGHAVGGLYAQLLATRQPGEIGGLVLIEPAHEDMLEEARPGVPEETWSSWSRRRGLPNADGVREAEVASRARSARLPDIPVTVITAMRRPDGEGFDERFLNQAARRVHASILRGVGGSRHVPASRSGPDVHMDEPDLVAAEILRVLGGSKRAVGR